LHNTRLGCWLVQAFFGFMYKSSHKLQQLGAGHPLHLDKDAIFWRLQMGGAVPSLPGNFYELVKAGKIQIVGPTHVSAVQGSSVAFENGETLDVAAVIASTGWAHSYIDLFSPEDAHKMGLTNRPASVQVPPRKELYLQRAPAPPNNFDAPLIWHGMIPTDEKSWLEHDIAVGGAIWPGSGNSIWEVTAHFISSWFLEDPFIKVPKTTQEAIQECEVENAYLRQRFPERNLFTMSL
jgi:dimethylaniline monooxygenase (N-oxide forming)